MEILYLIRRCVKLNLFSVYLQSCKNPRGWTEALYINAYKGALHPSSAENPLRPAQGRGRDMEQVVETPPVPAVTTTYRSHHRSLPISGQDFLNLSLSNTYSVVKEPGRLLRLL